MLPWIKQQKAVAIASGYFAAGIIVALAIYLLAARFFGPLVEDDQFSGAILDDAWLHALIVYVLGGLAVVMALRFSRRALERSGWPRPKRTVRIALLSALFLALLDYTVLPGLPLLPLLLVLVGYGAALYCLKTHPEWSGRLLKGLALGFVVLIGFTALAYVQPAQHTRAFVDTVWLPDPRQQLTDDDKLSLPARAMASQHYLYGASLLLDSNSVKGRPFTLRQALYQARANAWLNPAHCPNVAGIGGLVPGKCQVIGTVRGAKVYVITRDLALSDYEVYTQFGSTFITFDGGDSESSLHYLRTLRAVPANHVAAELAANHHRADTLSAKLEHDHDTAVQRLPFTLALPTALPAGWHQDDILPARVTGPDLDHPTALVVDYDDGKGHSVSVYLSR